VSAKVDYAMRALVALARVAPRPIKGDRLARDEDIPFRFLEVTLGELRHAGLVSSRRGSDGGYWLARDAREISMADVMIAIEGALVDLRAVPPAGDHADDPVRSASQVVWERAADDLRTLLSDVSLADLVDGTLRFERALDLDPADP
jgi:Rrf2 family protein